MNPAPKPAPKAKRPRRPLGRSEKPIRRSAIKPKPRKPSEFARIYGSRERVEWVKGLPCVVCRMTPCENAHIETGGVGRKAGFDKIAPLCSAHHIALHRWGRMTFENVCRPLDLDKAAAETQAAWLRVSGTPE